MAWIEQTSRRNQNAKHFQDSENPGRFRAEFTIHHRHYKDNNGRWQDVDESLVDDNTPGFAKRCDETRHIFQVGHGGERRWYPRRDVAGEYVSITEMQYWDESGGGRWRKLNLPAALWKGNKAEWTRQDLTVSITNTWRRVKLDFGLLTTDAPTRVRFEIEFTGLTYNDSTGELTSTTDGLVWGSIDKPTAQDANEAPVTVTQTYSAGWIEWGVDTTGATYPITVDPTFTDGYGGDVQTYIDALLYAPSPTTNYGTYQSVEIGTEADGDKERCVFKFDVSSLSGATVTSATFSLTTFTVGGQANNSPVIKFYSILSGNSNWTESGCCWNYRTGTTAWAGSAGCGTQGTDYSNTELGSQSTWIDDSTGTVDVTFDTSEIQAWVGGTNYGFLGKESTEPASEKRIYSYGSSDYATAANRPKLVVEYTEAAAGGNPYYAYAQQ